MFRVLVPEEYPEESLKFLKRFDIKLYKFPLEGNKVRNYVDFIVNTVGTIYRNTWKYGYWNDEYHFGLD